MSHLGYQEPPVIVGPVQAIILLLIIFAVPVFALSPVLDVNVGNLPHMLFESLGLGFLWSKTTSGTTDDEVYSYDKRRSKRKKLVRSRADLAPSVSSASPKTEVYYPGLVNISGTYCFLNATLQAMSSLSYLQPHLDNIYAKAETFDVSTPVLDALVAQLHALNSPSSRHTSLRPTEIIHALSTPTPGFKRGTLFASREHQDAQELFQLITETLKEEALEVDKEANKDRGLSGLGSSHTVYLHRPAREPGKGVFEGLTANRRSCVVCGYTEAVMHFAFDNLQLAVPRGHRCTLEECLQDFTRMEILTDCICRKCSLLMTLRRLEADFLKVSTPTDGPETPSRKKRIREAKKHVSRVKTALEEGRIEENIKGVTLDKAVSKSSTKQTMLARTPPVLALHLNRSAYIGHYASKNSCSVDFPEILDLTPFTTSGALSTAPKAPISTPSAPPLPARSSTPTPSVYSTPRTLYRLSSVVCHYGGHSFGHYVAYRRKPRDPALQSSRWSPPKLQCPYGCECERCQESGPIREADLFPDLPASRKGKERVREASGGGWLRISDDSVREVAIDTVLAEKMGAFMLFYERVLPFQSESVRTSPRSSQETVTPQKEEDRIKEEEEEIDSLTERVEMHTARIIRSVSVGNKSREGSVIRENAIEDAKSNGVPTPVAEKYANGHADPPSPQPAPLLPNGSASSNMLASPPESLVLSASAISHSGHHSPRSLSPVRTVDLVA